MSVSTHAARVFNIFWQHFEFPGNMEARIRVFGTPLLNISSDTAVRALPHPLAWEGLFGGEGERGE